MSYADTQKTIWDGAIASELRYWDSWFADRGGKWKADYDRRLNRATPINAFIVSMLPKGIGAARVLDVGSGPITNLGFSCSTRSVEIVATDPLADNYNEIMQKYGVNPPIPTRRCEAEALSTMFELSSFDLVHSSNALDHSYDPPEAIRQMFAVCKSGGKVIISLFRNEGINENYAGLHQWNFDEHQNKIVMFSKTKICYLDEIVGANYSFSISFPKGMDNIIKPGISITIDK